MNKNLTFLFAVLVVLSCSKSKEHFTDDGLRYILHVDSAGKKPQKGDYVTIELVCHTADTVLLDTRRVGTPYRFRLDNFPFKGCYEMGLTYIGVGDSATFYVAADSLYHYLFSGEGKDSVPQEKTLLKKGTFVQYDVKMLNIQDYVSAEQEMQMRFSAMEKKEKKILDEFIERNKISVKADSNGLYKVVAGQGNGLQVDTSKVIAVFFRGRLMDGSVFGATEKNKPYRFLMRDKNVIPAWVIALSDAKVGDRFSLIVPSRLAYGEEGLLDPTTGKFAVPPYSPLIYDIVVAGVEEPNPASAAR